MSDVVFTTQPDATLPLFLMNPPATPGVPAGYQIGYWVTSAKPWPQVPLTLSQSWNGATGVYLFLNATPSDVEQFASSLEQLLANATFTNARFLWIANPNDALQEWAVQQIAATQPAGVVTSTAQLVFQNYAVSIGAGATFALSGTSGFTLTAAAANAMGFSAAGDGWYPLTGGGSDPNLALTGSAMGCVALSMSVSPAMTDFFDDLNTGIWYFRNDPTFSGMAQPLRYPLFGGPPPSMVLSGLFDPINPLAPLRTRLGFQAGGAAMASWFRSNYGLPFTLAPATSTFTGYPPSLVFQVLQNRNPPDPEAPYSMVPAGAFALSAGAAESDPPANFVPPAARLMCGIAGIEYLGLASATGALLQFVPGQPAYVAPDETADSPKLTAKTASEPLLPIATTSWCYASPATTGSAVTYFAQPADAALYDSNGSAYLEFLEVPAAPLPQTVSSTPPCFPMAPYAGVVASDLGAYEEIETAVLSPARRNVIASLATSPPAAEAAPDDDEITGVTPQGLLVTLDTTRTQWDTLTLGQHGNPSNAASQTLQLHDIEGGFRDALQTNQLFAVLRDAATVMSACELEYEITNQVINDLQTKVDPVPQSVTNTLIPLKGTTYASDAAFQGALQPAMGADYAQYGAEVTQYAAKFGVELEGWRFRLSPTMWTVITDKPTLMIFKYADGALADLARDVNSWSWSAAAGSDPAETQEYLLSILNSAAAAVGTGEVPTDLDYFVNVVMRDPSWNGILFLNANVPVTSMPDQLSGIAAGIDPAKFVAHHLGIELTTIDTTVTPLQLSDSAFFGLILYDDPVDLYFNGDLYDFKVLLLDVLFRNSTIANFASRIELMANAWFGEFGDLTPSEHNNNLILDGSYQKQGDSASYVFEQRGSSRFVMRSAVMEEVEITKVQFVTVEPPEGSSVTAQSASRFLMWGYLRYRELPFDLFSFGKKYVGEVMTEDGFLRFSGLSVDMQSNGMAGGTKLFAFNARSLAFDAAASHARPGSVYAQLPLVIGGLLNGTPGSRPEDLGYVAVKTPLSASTLDGSWYGLTFQADLGTLGALAGQLGFVVSLLAAWAPATPPPGTNAAQTRPPSASVQVGLLLPGGRSLTSLIPIQGVVGLGFSGIDLTPSSNESGTSYMLKFRRFVLSLLGWSFPPGQADLAFFTNPNNSGRSALGWYAAYVGADEEES